METETRQTALLAGPVQGMPAPVAGYAEQAEAVLDEAARGLPPFQRLVARNILEAESYAAAMQYIDTVKGASGE